MWRNNQPLQYDNQEYQQRLGIKGYKEQHLSYRKLYNNESLPYEKNGVFFIDGLSILFKCNLNHPFFSNPHKYADDDFHNRFNITDGLTLVNANGGEKSYLQNYFVEINEVQVGIISVSNTRRRQQVKFKVANHILYQYNPIVLIDMLMVIATTFDLYFQNIGIVDVAYDSPVNYLKKVEELYYQSNGCSPSVHSAHNSEPKYTFKGKRDITKVIFDFKSKTGMYQEGSQKSATSVKVYNKTQQMVKAGKKYIQELHQQLFGAGDDVYRVEVRANHQAFYKKRPLYGFDLFEILLPENRHDLFNRILGNKLCFKPIKPEGHNENRNAIRSDINILSLGEPKMVSKPTIKCNFESSHNNHINKLGHLLKMFLDGEIPIISVVSFIDQNKPINALEVIFKTTNNYRNPIDAPKQKMLLKLEKYIDGRMGVIEKKLFWLEVKFLH